MPHVNFCRTPSRRVYDALWCFDDRKKSAFYAFLSRARQKHLLVNPGAPIQRYHSKIFPKIFMPDLARSHIAEYSWGNTVVDNSRNFWPPELKPPAEDWAYPLSSKNYLHVNPTSGWKSKNWTPDDSNQRSRSGTRANTVNTGSRARILLIEDEGKTARAVLNGLRAEGFAPAWAETGEDGFFLLSSEHFDAVVLDWMLPGRSGWKF
jgi:hypothetical protein